MKLVTRKSECIKQGSRQLVKSPKEAIKRTLDNYTIKDGIIIKVYQPSYISKDEIVLRNDAGLADFNIRLGNSNSFVNATN